MENNLEGMAIGYSRHLLGNREWKKNEILVGCVVKWV
jgi:hypothetical protein